MGSVCPATAWLAHEHLATLYRLARATGAGRPLADAVSGAALLAERGAEAVELGTEVVVDWPQVAGPAARTIASFDESPAAVADPGFSAEPYVIRAALASAVVNGVGTDLLRHLAKSGHAPHRPLGAAVTQLLTSQAATLRGLSRLDTMSRSGQSADGAVSAAFHTTVRGGVRALLAVLETLVGHSDGLYGEPFARLPTVLKAMADHPVLGDDSWDVAVAASLSGDWTCFEALSS